MSGVSRIRAPSRVTVESAARICFLGSDAYFTGSPMLRRIAGLAKAK